MSADRKTWAAGMKALHQEAAGCLELWPILATDMPDLMAAAGCGSVEAFRLLTIINYTLRQVQDAPPRKPALCGCCARPIRNARFAFTIAKPANQPDAERSLALVICEGCGTDRDSVRAAAVRALQEMWPDARPIDLTHQEGGRA